MPDEVEVHFKMATDDPKTTEGTEMPERSHSSQLFTAEACVAGILAFIIGIYSKNPLGLIAILVMCVSLLTHAIYQTDWVRKSAGRVRKWRMIIAPLACVAVFAFIGYLDWPPPVYVALQFTRIIPASKSANHLPIISVNVKNLG